MGFKKVILSGLLYTMTSGSNNIPLLFNVLYIFFVSFSLAMLLVAVAVICSCIFHSFFSCAFIFEGYWSSINYIIHTIFLPPQSPPASIQQQRFYFSLVILVEKCEKVLFFFRLLNQNYILSFPFYGNIFVFVVWERKILLLLFNVYSRGRLWWMYNVCYLK